VELLPVLFVLLMVFGMIAIGTKLAKGHSLGSRYYRSLADLGSDLERRCGLEVVARRDDWLARLDDLALSGKLATGRPARVEFETVPRGKERVIYTRFRVAAPGSPWLSIRREGFFDKLGKWIGVSRDLDVGDRAFDDRFLIQTSSDEKALVAFARGLKDAVRRAFEKHGIESLVAREGWLIASVRTSSLEPENYPILLDVLDRAAQSFERQSIPVRVLQRERRALVAEGKTRCAYCHDGITGDEPDLVACPRCQTVLHDGCWSENRHCPVLGCAETTPERPGVT
jgi:hypothetical protein